ncbi:MAG: TrbI/VirB10 family protein [Sphingomonadaceae bacterium]|nr:TrbI/VirB10 family protein [Sphingomonadaceae bacterium]
MSGAADTGHARQSPADDERPAAHQLSSEAAGMADPRLPAGPATDAPFRLSGQPPRIVRLSRRVITCLAATGCIGLGGVLIFALQSRSPDKVEALPTSQGRNRAESITSAPSDYAKIPTLGAPLPGDLGRPILSAQQRGVMQGPAGSAAGAGRTNMQTAQDRRRVAQEAATASKIFLDASSSRSGSSATEAEPILGQPAIAPSLSMEDVSARPGTVLADRRDFLEAGTPVHAVSAQRITKAASPYIVQAGSFIPAALMTSIRSDLPGQITAQVVENVYDSPTGRILLIPQGARLIGEYDSATAAGQRRVLFAWDRLILPNGASMLLDRTPGADSAGMSGLQDRVDHHWTGMLGAALISTLLGVGTELATNDDDAFIQALRYGTQDTINQTGRQMVQRQMAIPPTLTIRPGHSLRVMVTRDLVLEPWERKD